MKEVKGCLFILAWKDDEVMLKIQMPFFRQQAISGPSWKFQIDKIIFKNFEHFT